MFRRTVHTAELDDDVADRGAGADREVPGAGTHPADHGGQASGTELHRSVGVVGCDGGAQVAVGDALLGRARLDHAEPPGRLDLDPDRDALGLRAHLRRAQNESEARGGVRGAQRAPRVDDPGHGHGAQQRRDRQDHDQFDQRDPRAPRPPPSHPSPPVWLAASPACRPRKDEGRRRRTRRRG